VIEYVSLGDFQTAVGFLLASTPERSIRYYRDALCTLALAVSPCHCLARPCHAREPCVPFSMVHAAAFCRVSGVAATTSVVCSLRRPRARSRT
jgi:hypothetical protein